MSKKSGRSHNSYVSGNKSVGSLVSRTSQKSRRTNTLDMVVIGGFDEPDPRSKTGGVARYSNSKKDKESL